MQRQKEALERSIQSRKEEEEAMEQARLALQRAEEDRRKEEEDKRKEEEDVRKEEEDRRKEEEDRRKEEEDRRKEETRRKGEEQREEERQKARQETQNTAADRRRQRVGNKGGKGDDRPSRKTRDQQREAEDAEESARSDNDQSGTNLEDSMDGREKGGVKDGERGGISVKRKNGAHSKKKERRPSKNGSSVKRKEKAGGGGMRGGEWEVVDEGQEDDIGADQWGLTNVDQAQDDKLSAMLLSAIPSQLPGVPFAQAPSPYQSAPFAAYPSHPFSEAPSFPPHFSSATGMWDRRRDAGFGWDMGRGAGDISHGASARGEWERYRNPPPRQPPGAYSRPMGLGSAGAGGGIGPSRGAGAGAPWQDPQRWGRRDFDELDGLEGDRDGSADVRKDAKQSLAREAGGRERSVVGKESVAKGEDSGVSDLKNQVDKVRAETEAAMRQVQSAEAALAQVKQGETATPVSCKSSTSSHITSHSSLSIQARLHSLFFLSCSLFRMSCPAQSCSHLLLAHPAPLPTPCADAAAKQQHVQALTTSLEKVFSLREKMNSAQVLLQARCTSVRSGCMHACAPNFLPRN